MYKVRKTFEIAGAHQLKLNYNSKCENLHGHNWIIAVELASSKLNEDGMVYDFTHIKQLITNPISETLDHKNLNDVFSFNPTAENIARWIWDYINGSLENVGSDVHCTAVEVQESPNNTAIFEVCSCK